MVQPASKKSRQYVQYPRFKRATAPSPPNTPSHLPPSGQHESGNDEAMDIDMIDNTEVDMDMVMANVVSGDDMANVVSGDDKVNVVSGNDMGNMSAQPSHMESPESRRHHQKKKLKNPKTSQDRVKKNKKEKQRSLNTSMGRVSHAVKFNQMPAQSISNQQIIGANVQETPTEPKAESIGQTAQLPLDMHLVKPGTLRSGRAYRIIDKHETELAARRHTIREEQEKFEHPEEESIKIKQLQELIPGLSFRNAMKALRDRDWNLGPAVPYAAFLHDRGVEPTAMQHQTNGPSVPISFNTPLSFRPKPQASSQIGSHTDALMTKQAVAPNTTQNGYDFGSSQEL